MTLWSLKSACPTQRYSGEKKTPKTSGPNLDSSLAEGKERPLLEGCWEEKWDKVCPAFRASNVTGSQEVVVDIVIILLE